MTGNGRCNFWNEDQNLVHYRSNNLEKIEKILNKNNQIKILDFLKKIGIEPKIKNGYYYPYSNQAVSIQQALILEAQKQGVKIRNKSNVIDVKSIVSLVMVICFAVLALTGVIVASDFINMFSIIIVFYFTRENNIDKKNSQQ